MLLLAVGCTPDGQPAHYVARVGQQVLSEDDLGLLLAQAVPGQDTVALREALVNQWVANALLYDAAMRDDLLRDPDLQRQIEQNRRAIVTSAYVERHLDENPPTFSDEAIETYFEQNRERLLLREPYLHYHLLGAPAEETVRRARQQVTRRVIPDTLWNAFRDRRGFVVVVDSAAPERGLYATRPEVRDALLSLSPGQTSGVISTDTLYFVAHLVARIDAGQPAPLAWVRPEIEHRLTLDRRKQMARRLVQTLRTEAIARGDLDLRADTLQ